VDADEAPFSYLKRVTASFNNKKIRLRREPFIVDDEEAAGIMEISLKF